MSELRATLRSMSREQLVAEVARLRDEHAKVADELRTGKEKNHGQLAGKRRAVATALTVLRELDLAQTSESDAS